MDTNYLLPLKHKDGHEKLNSLTMSIAHTRSLSQMKMNTRYCPRVKAKSKNDDNGWLFIS